MSSLLILPVVILVVRLGRHLVLLLLFRVVRIVPVWLLLLLHLESLPLVVGLLSTAHLHWSEPELSLRDKWHLS